MRRFRSTVDAGSRRVSRTGHGLRRDAPVPEKLRACLSSLRVWAVVCRRTCFAGPGRHASGQQSLYAL